MNEYEHALKKIQLNYKDQIELRKKKLNQMYYHLLEIKMK